MDMTGICRTAGFIIDRTDNTQQTVPRGRIEYPCPFSKVKGNQRRVGSVTDITGFCLYIGCPVNFQSPAGKFYLTVFIINAYVFNILLPGNIIYDLVNVIS